MIYCPNCESPEKLIKVGNLLTCSKCNYTHPHPAPSADSFTVIENNITIECAPQDVLTLSKEVTVLGEKGDKGFSQEYVIKQKMEKEPFVGSKLAKKYRIEISYKIIAEC